jgi:hypothetical protein
MFAIRFRKGTWMRVEFFPTVAKFSMHVWT